MPLTTFMQSQKNSARGVGSKQIAGSPKYRLKSGPHLLQKKARGNNTSKWQVVGENWTKLRKHDMTQLFGRVSF